MHTVYKKNWTGAGLTNVGGQFGKICAAYPQDQNERTIDRVLFNFCHTISTSIFVYSCEHFRLVCSEMFSLFLLIGNFDLLIFLAHVWGPQKCKAGNIP